MPYNVQAKQFLFLAHSSLLLVIFVIDLKSVLVRASILSLTPFQYSSNLGRLESKNTRNIASGYLGRYNEWILDIEHLTIVMCASKPPESGFVGEKSTRLNMLVNAAQRPSTLGNAMQRSRLERSKNDSASARLKNLKLMKVERNPIRECALRWCACRHTLHHTICVCDSARVSGVHTNDHYGPNQTC